MKPAISREAFAEFCESKPADEAYKYWRTDACACSQYATAAGFEPDAYDGMLAASRRGKGDPLWTRLDDVAARKPWTFGALAKRLREAV